MEWLLNILFLPWQRLCPRLHYNTGTIKTYRIFSNQLNEKISSQCKIPQTLFSPALSFCILNAYRLIMASTRALALDLLSLSVTLQQLQRGGWVHEIEVTEVMTRALFKGFTPYGFPFCKAKVMYQTIFFWRRQGQASQRNGTEVLWWNGKAKKRMWEIEKVGTRYRFWRLLKDCADCRKLLAKIYCFH